MAENMSLILSVTEEKFSSLEKTLDKLQSLVSTYKVCCIEEGVKSADIAKSGTHSADSTMSTHSADSTMSTHSAEIAKSGTHSADIAKSTHSADIAKSTHSADIAKSTHSADIAKSGTHSADIAKSTHSADIAKSTHSADIAKSTHSADIAKSTHSADIAKSGTHSADIAKSADTVESSIVVAHLTSLISEISHDINVEKELFTTKSTLAADTVKSTHSADTVKSTGYKTATKEYMTSAIKAKYAESAACSVNVGSTLVSSVGSVNKGDSISVNKGDSIRAKYENLLEDLEVVELTNGLRNVTGLEEKGRTIRFLSVEGEEEEEEFLSCCGSTEELCVEELCMEGLDEFNLRLLSLATRVLQV